MQAQPQTIRAPAVAGSFYEAEPQRLMAHLDALLGAAPSTSTPSPRPKALLVPHAGYVYSGPTAACAYSLVAAMDPKPTRVVLLGPSHTTALRGLALPGCDALETPLGVVPIDHELARLAAELPQVSTSARAHAEEHALEVQVPFLQRVLGDFTLLPLAVGHAPADAVAAVLDALWGGPETLVLISSDLSHFLPSDAARVKDAATVEAIVHLDERALSGDQACGAYPLNGFVACARRRGLRATLLDLRNSGDTAGPPGRVVGYAAVAFSEGAS